MNIRFVVLMGLAALVLVSACRHRAYEEPLEKARRSFAEKKYVDTIDTLILTLPRWPTSDGEEQKAEAYELLGRSYHELHTIEKAIDAYQRALSLSEQRFEAAYHLGLLYLGRNEPELALEAFTKAVNAHPTHALAQLGQANCLYALGQYGKAERAFERVLDVSPGVREAMESLTILHRQRVPETLEIGDGSGRVRREEGRVN